MSAHGPAQLELIRRYARTLRALHADAGAPRPTPRADREARIDRDRDRAPARPAPIRPAARAVADRTQPAP